MGLGSSPGHHLLASKSLIYRQELPPLLNNCPQLFPHNCLAADLQS